MFATGSLVRRIERAEAGVIAESARAASRRIPAGQLIVMEMNGGVGVYVEPDMPFNKVAGVGFEGVPAADVLDALERQFRERQAPLQFEVATLADPELVRTLTKRGYELVGFENVLGLDLLHTTLDVATPYSGLDVQRAAADESQVWLDVVATAAMTPDVFDGPASHEAHTRDVLERAYSDTIAAPGFERYLARVDRELAGGATFRIQDRVAQFGGAATLPEHRRKGVQTALLRHRLAEVARRGCDVAVVTTQPGSKSQENVQKSGFELLYARAILVKEPKTP